MEFTIRRAMAADAAAIARVQIESWRSTYAGIVPEEFLAAMDLERASELWQQLIGAPENATFVAEDPQGVFGFISGGRLRSNPALPDGFDAELYAIYLFDSHHRQGVGRALLRTLVDALRVSGLAGMVVWVLKRNPAVGFYRSVGAVPLAEATIEISGVSLVELALCWPHLAAVSI